MYSGKGMEPTYTLTLETANSTVELTSGLGLSWAVSQGQRGSDGYQTYTFADSLNLMITIMIMTDVQNR